MAFSRLLSHCGNSLTSLANSVMLASTTESENGRFRDGADERSGRGGARLGAGRRIRRVRRAGRGDQSALRRAEASAARSVIFWRATSRAPRTWPTAIRAPSRAISASASARPGPPGTDMITGLYAAAAEFDPDPLHHRPGAARQALQGGFPGDRHRERSPSRSPNGRSPFANPRWFRWFSSRRST